MLSTVTRYVGRLPLCSGIDPDSVLAQRPDCDSGRMYGLQHAGGYVILSRSLYRAAQPGRRNGATENRRSETGRGGRALSRHCWRRTAP